MSEVNENGCKVFMNLIPIFVLVSYIGIATESVWIIECMGGDPCMGQPTLGISNAFG